MSVFRNIVIVLFGFLAIYTVFTIANVGINFVPVFVADLMSVTWRGQIGFDFLSYLILSGLWVAWRHDFTGGGIALAIIVVLGGMLAFALYLLFAIGRSEGDLNIMLLGQQRTKT